MVDYDVAVIFGGISNENQISIITGTMTCNVLTKGGKRVLPLFICQKGKMYAGAQLSDISNYKGDGYKKSLRAAIVDGGVMTFSPKGRAKRYNLVACAINCCHGGYGEGGGISGVCAMNNIPLASAGIFESSAFLNKYYTKLILSSLGVNTLPYVRVNDKKEGAAAAEKLGWPVIVKPTNLGSSIGICVANNSKELDDAISVALEYDDSALIEKFVQNAREINCAAYMAGGKVVTSQCEEAVHGGGILSFDDKYLGGAKSVYPADIPQDTANSIKDTVRYVYSQLNMRGIVRFDFLISRDEVYVNELNTVPGSLAYYLLAHGFKDFYNVLCSLIDQSKADFAARGEKRLLNCRILNNFTANACKIK